MNYNESLKYINSIPKFSKILGNDELSRLLLRLENPQNKLRFVHIAGTNGKGSVSAMTASVMAECGLTVGLYTSPFIEVFNERIQINGENIPDDELAEAATRVRCEVENLCADISAFAQITAMAFLYFAKKKCDLVILEAGLGGLLDATNVINAPEVCAITKIGLDHTEYLGDTTEKIAEQKCGIIKHGTIAVTCRNQDASALRVIEASCKKACVPLKIADEYEGELGLFGDFQKSNAGIAEKICLQLGAGYEEIKRGLKNAKWPARFEFLKKNLVLDGGHNPDGVHALISSLSKLGKRIIFVVAMMADKDVENSAAQIRATAKKVIVTQIDMPRCMSAEELSRLFPSSDVENDCIAAVRTALELCGKGEIVCVCGSLYLAGEIRPHFKD